MEFPGQGSDGSCSCHLRHSWGNTESSTHCVRLGIELVSQRFQGTADPTAAQWKLLHDAFLNETIAKENWPIKLLM